jgi:hypothetical protein
VFTFLTLIVYKDWHAFLIIGLVARLSTTNTSVLRSSIVLIALSVLRGNLMTAKLSQVLTLLTAWLIALGLRSLARVLGRLNVVFVQTLVFDAAWTPFLATLATAFA